MPRQAAIARFDAGSFIQSWSGLPETAAYGLIPTKGQLSDSYTTHLLYATNTGWQLTYFLLRMGSDTDASTRPEIGPWIGLPTNLEQTAKLATCPACCIYEMGVEATATKGVAWQLPENNTVEM